MLLEESGREISFGDPLRNRGRSDRDLCRTLANIAPIVKLTSF